MSGRRFLRALTIRESIALANAARNMGSPSADNLTDAAHAVRAHVPGAASLISRAEHAADSLALEGRSAEAARLLRSVMLMRQALGLAPTSRARGRSGVKP